MIKLRPRALNALGIVRSFPKALTHGPISAQGLGLSHVVTVQGIKHYCKVVKFVSRAESLTGSLILASYEQLLLEVGLQPPLFQRPIKPLLKMLTPCWLTHFWEFLCHSGLSMIDTGFSFALHRHHDSLIMESLLSLEPTPDELKQANLCRLWLQALTLSDLTNGLSSSLDPQIVDGKQRCVLHSNYGWPKVPRPPSSFWVTWRDLVTRTYCSRGLLLRQPLGTWIQTASILDMVVR